MQVGTEKNKIKRSLGANEQTNTMTNTWETDLLGNLPSGKLPSGKLTFWETSYCETSFWEKSSGKLPQGNILNMYI